ncbi:MAG: chemotaxis protein CheA [Proteobacteria bacterium]|nr:chemotaxis protein CheA [Pseudomonadota bacterium]MBU1737245.1 chemotaxis protein CheA [Pseudomonadota bacterium]
MDPHQTAYLEEAKELLVELETSLLELEDTPDDQELIGRVFRALHTIKGSGAMFGFDRIAEFTHQVETAFDLVRSGKIPVTSEMINLTLRARDEIKAMLEEAETGETTDPGSAEEIINAFIALTTGAAPPAPEPPPQLPPAENVRPGIIAPDRPEIKGRLTTFRILFKPRREILQTGTNPILLLDELNALGECTIIVNNEKIPSLHTIDTEQCYVSWEILLTTDQGINSVRDVFIFVEDLSEIVIEVLEEDLDSLDDSQQKRLGEILIERREISAEALTACLDKQKRIGEVLIGEKLISNQAVANALAQQQHSSRVLKKQKELAETSTIRVEANRLDKLVNLVGELVTLQARLGQKAFRENDPDLISISEEADRLTSALRNNAMSIRMLPIGKTFSKFRRLVRDLSKNLGKEIILTTEGEETELDKTVIDKLNDPLVHLIRNCIDHGIELPEERMHAGKAGQGTIHLKAFHSGANVFLQITDDGKGLDCKAIHAKGVEKGIIQADTVLAEKELFALIFAPGFSTAKTVSDVSGRGVGMDVVKKNIDALRGTIEIESRQGSGTTVTLKLPLTLAIIDGLLVQIGKGFFVIPLSAVEECLEVTRTEANQALERSMLSSRGEILSYISLRRLFSCHDTPPPLEKIVVIEENGHRIGLGLDSVIGQHQTVIKGLSKVYQNVKGLSGATILGDGTMALILDIPQLAQCVKSEPPL